MDVRDISEFEDTRGEVMSRKVLQYVPAVKEGRVYVIAVHLLSFFGDSGCRSFIQLAYQAKWFQPELFEDLDPKAIHQEYLTRFQGLDIDLDENGVFVYTLGGNNMNTSRIAALMMLLASIMLLTEASAVEDEFYLECLWQRQHGRGFR